MPCASITNLPPSRLVAGAHCQNCSLPPPKILIGNLPGGLANEVAKLVKEIQIARFHKKGY